MGGEHVSDLLLRMAGIPWARDRVRATAAQSGRRRVLTCASGLTPLLLVAATACGAHTTRPAAVPGEGVAGTYAVEVYPALEATTEPPSVSGYLVLEDSTFSLDEISEPARSQILRSAFLLARVEAEGRPNACFVLEGRSATRTYAGLASVGMTRWRHQAVDSITIALYRSPDAGHRATFVLRGNRIGGRGTSWGAGDWHRDLPDDRIRGRRLGPPDRDLCIRAAEIAAAEHRNMVFLRDHRTGPDERLKEFFPAPGEFTYVHTAHQADGPRTDSTRFTLADTAALRTFFHRVLDIDYHGQTVGLFAHQVLSRGIRWRRVAGTTRFVPPDAPDDAAIFVEWRLEDGRWVISSMGDESFPSGRTPPWCC